MTLEKLLTSFIYLVSSSLFLPVLLLLFAATLWLTYYTGSLFGTWVQRRRVSAIDDPIAALRSHALENFQPQVRIFITSLEALQTHKDKEAAILNLLRDTEHRLWKSLDKLKLLIRTGPGLGLIGTLIPMGTGLAGLSQGDFNRLTGDLVIAFTTTVVGMMLGLAGYCFFTIRRRWVEEDLKNIELAAEILSRPDQEK